MTSSSLAEVSDTQTNESSIVSKRSVSKLYRPDEPDFYEPFVQEHKRRSPLINRGHWLRMQAIEVTVRKFLAKYNRKNKIVVNLGCGYDPLPFQILDRHRALCCHATFVDVDYPQVIEKKTEYIRTSALLQKYHQAAQLQDSAVPCLVRHDHYVALGCDLRNVDGLEKALRREFDLEDVDILFVAEVSLTCMDVKTADSLIRWAASLTNARFCLLEPCLPNGPNNPFARTMLDHFTSLQPPLQSASVYPQLVDQRKRFTDAGWPVVRTKSLWELWTDPEHVTADERLQLDAVEPFDEWEEFAMLGTHFFLLLADQTEETSAQTTNGPSYWNRDLDWTCTDLEEKSWAAALAKVPISGSLCSQILSCTRRRFGATFRLGDTVAVHGGLGQDRRLKCLDIFQEARSQDSATTTVTESLPTAQAYMCHSITPLSDEEALMTGGRTSPCQASSNCWHLKQEVWQQSESLEPGRFRHCAVKVSVNWQGQDSNGVLVFGGKTSFGNVLGDWHLWIPGSGWQTVSISDRRPPARFGASLATLPTNARAGFLTGGMSAEGVIIADLWLWEISCEAGVALLFEDLSERVAIEARCTFPRFGAQMVAFEGEMLLMGGVAPGRVPEDKDEILVITPAGQVQRLHVEASSGSRPLLIGFGAAATASGDIFIVGGGSTCSSMGTCWNTDAFLLTRGSAGKTGNWHLSTHRVEEAEQEQVPTRSKHVNGNIPTGQTNGSISATTKPPTVKQIPRLRITAEKEFTEIISRGEPVVLEGMDLGPCTHQWTPAYLEQKIGADRTVIIHSCSTDRMTFQTKNFSYLKSPFGEFINSVSHGAQSYLRSVSTIQPGKHPTLLSRDFPTISPDFHLPPIFHSINETIHSSPLRISGPLTLWLHYDVLANILCQIRGTKTLRLYPPADAPHLSFPPGGSSSNIDVFGAIAANPALAHTHPQEARMGPGDVLFIPPMWAHAARPTGGMSVAVNVFWRNLERGVYAVGRDVYGNRDLAAYESGRKEVERVVKGFEGVPVEVARFYLGRLVEELKGKVQEYGGDRGDEAQEFRGANT